jgi:hypothetical protein
MQSRKGMKIRPYNYVCRIRGQQGLFCQVRGRGEDNTRLVRADGIRGEMLEDFGRKYANELIEDRQTFEQWLAGN